MVSGVTDYVTLTRRNYCQLPIVEAGELFRALSDFAGGAGTVLNAASQINDGSANIT